jgi:hypothetical protein
MLTRNGIRMWKPVETVAGWQWMVVRQGFHHRRETR